MLEELGHGARGAVPLEAELTKESLHVADLNLVTTEGQDLLNLGATHHISHRDGLEFGRLQSLHHLLAKKMDLVRHVHELERGQLGQARHCSRRSAQHALLDAVARYSRHDIVRWNPLLTVHTIIQQGKLILIHFHFIVKFFHHALFLVCLVEVEDVAILLGKFS